MSEYVPGTSQGGPAQPETKLDTNVIKSIVDTIGNIFNNIGSTTISRNIKYNGVTYTITKKIANELDAMDFYSQVYQKTDLATLQAVVNAEKGMSSLPGATGAFQKWFGAVGDKFLTALKKKILELSQPINLGADGLNSPTPTSSTVVVNETDLAWLKIALMGPFAPFILGLGKVKNG